MTTYSWKLANNGNWSTASSWTPAGPPNAGSADAVIGVAGSYAVTVDSNSTYSLDSLTLSDPGAILYMRGELDFSGARSLRLTAGTLDLEGTIKGATLSATGGVIQYNGGTLSGATIRGPLDLTFGSVVVTNGITLTGADGTGPGAVEIGYDSSLATIGDITLDHATVTLAGGELRSSDRNVAGVLTLGSGLTLQDSAYGVDLLTGQGGFAGDGIVNQGTIIAAINGGAFVVGGGGTFTNQGRISVSNGDTLELASTSIGNTGTITVTDSTLQIWGTLNGFGTILANHSIVYLSGELINTGSTLALGAGSGIGALTLGGTVLGGVIADGGLGLIANGGTLSGVVYRGTLDLSIGGGGPYNFEAPLLTIANGITLTGASGSGPGAIVVGASILYPNVPGEIALDNSTSLDNAIITLKGGRLSGGDEFGTGQPLIFGKNLTVQDGGYGSLYFQDSYAGDGIVNQGMIIAGLASSISPQYRGITVYGQGTFSNQGTISISNGDTIDIEMPSFSNTGRITVTAATLRFWETVSVPSLGHIDATTGTIAVSGLLVNTGSTLSIGAGTGIGRLLLSGGTITGGVIADGGLGLIGPTNSYGTLDAVTYRGTLSFSSFDSLSIVDGLTLTDASGNGPGAVALGSRTTYGQLYFINSTTLNNATITLTSGYLYSTSLSFSAQVLTLGAGLLVEERGYGLLSTTSNRSGDGIINRGTIIAGFSGGYGLHVYGPVFINQGTISVSNGDVFDIESTRFTNTGTINVNAATLRLGGTVTSLGKIIAGSGTVDLAGSLVNTGGTLSIGAGSSIGTLLLRGSIIGGVVVDSGRVLIINSGTLDGVTYRGALTVGAVGTQTLDIADGITLTGAAGTGPGSVALGSRTTSGKLYFSNSTTLNNATITLTSGYLYIVDTFAADQVLTLGSGLIVQDGGYGLISTYSNLAGDGIVNQGTIIAGFAGGYGLHIYGPHFTNQGSIIVSNGDAVTIAASNFTNLSGTILTGGTYSVTGVSTLAVSSATAIATLNAAVTLNGAGSVIETFAGAVATRLEASLTTIGASGALSLLGNRGFATANAVTDNGRLLLIGGTFASAGTLSVGATGVLSGFGIISPAIADTGTIDASGGILKLAGAVSGAGGLRIETAATLELAAAASSSVTFAAGAVATLQLDAPAQFTGAIGGLAVNDAIVFSGETVTAAVINGSTLTVTGSAGTTKYQVAGALTGNHVAVQPDGHTVKLVAGALALSNAAFLAPAATTAAAPTALTLIASQTPTLTIGPAWPHTELASWGGGAALPLAPTPVWAGPVLEHH